MYVSLPSNIGGSLFTMSLQFHFSFACLAVNKLLFNNKLNNKNNTEMPAQTFVRRKGCDLFAIHKGLSNNLNRAVATAFMSEIGGINKVSRQQTV